MLDCVDADRLVPFWETALDYRLNDKLDEYRVLVPRDENREGPVLVLATVPDRKLAKNRMHLDCHPDDPESHIMKLRRLGATLVDERHERFGLWWQSMADPEGNEFCVMAGAVGPDEGDVAGGG